MRYSEATFSASMKYCLRTLLLSLLAGFTCCFVFAAQDKPDPRTLFQRMASAGPNICASPADDPPDEDKVESAILDLSQNIILNSLNAAHAKPEDAKEIIANALRPLQQMSAEAEAAWPQENRFHFEVVEVLPLVAVMFTYRDYAHYRVFGFASSSEAPSHEKWQDLGRDEFEGRFASLGRLHLYPLSHGLSHRPRFLMHFQGGGCAGSLGVQYVIQELDESGYLSEVLKQAGALGLDASPEQPPTKKEPFPTVGELKTDGPRITLPYCVFTHLDTWDNPSLCMVDTYDLSGDAVRFVSRRYNRPDLIPVAKALEYAEAHDLPAVRAYCASDEVARKIMREGYGFGSQLEVVDLGQGPKRVRAAYSNDRGFVVQKRGGRWLIVSFASN